MKSGRMEVFNWSCCVNMKKPSEHSSSIDNKTEILNLNKFACPMLVKQNDFLIKFNLCGNYATANNGQWNPFPIILN